MKKLSKLFLAVFCVVLLSVNCFSLSVKAETKQAKTSEIEESKEEIEYADQEEFLKKLRWTTSAGDVDSFKEAFPNIDFNEFIAVISERSTRYDRSVFGTAFLLKEYKDATFEDEELNILAHELVTVADLIVRSDSIKDSSINSDFRYNSLIILFYSDLIEISQKYDIALTGDIDNSTSLTQYFADEMGVALGIKEAKPVDGKDKKTDSNQSSATPNSDDVSVENTYTFSIANYLRMFLVVKNNTEQDLNVTVEVTMVDKDGEPVSFHSDQLTALGPGCSFPADLAFNKDEIGEDYQIEIKTNPASFLYSATPDISYELKKVKAGVIVKVTNNGDTEAIDVFGQAVFFKEGKPVHALSGGFGNPTLKPGETATKQLSCSMDFDDVEFYLKGCRY